MLNKHINLRKIWKPGISNKWSAQNNDFLKPMDAATEKVKWIIDNYKPEPLDARVKEELKRIIETAEKEFTG